MQHTEPHPLAGQTVTLKPVRPLPHQSEPAPAFRIEDWNDRVYGRSWMHMNGNPAALAYALRSAGFLPLDNDVVYGKDDRGRGHLVHVDEIEDADRE